ncbi:uncharacterized protein K441DRAFT_597361, partial [Cenococcum geophilum 1.58]
YAYATLTNSWTDDSLGLYYIKHYNKYTRQLIEDAEGYRMLLIDNYLSHLTWQFI